MKDNHLTIGIYSNMDYKYNVVRDEDLESHIEYNLIMRPGRIFYVDGERKNNGMIKEEYLHKYDDMARSLYANLKVNMNIPTIPYR